jgi:hypothetical protein
MLGTQCEFDENTMRTTKILTPSPSLERRKKKNLGSWCMLSHLLEYKNFYFFYTYVFCPFFPRLMGRAKLWIKI